MRDWRSVIFAALAAAAAGVLVACSSSPPALPAGALNGIVTSADEGPMEGVLVSAKGAGSSVTITVVSDAQGAVLVDMMGNATPADPPGKVVIQAGMAPVYLVLTGATRAELGG